MNRWALITGASGGLGGAFAELLAQEGYSLLLSGRDVLALETRKKHLESRFSVSCKVVLADLALGREGLAALFQEGESLSLSWVILAGAMYDVGGFQDCNARLLENLSTANVNSMAQLVSWSLLQLQKTSCHEKGLIGIGSLGALFPAPDHAIYTASKAWLHQLFFSLQEEPTGVSVTLAVPGGLKTAMLLESPAWKKLQQSVLLRYSVIAPEKAAKEIFSGAKKQKKLVVPGFYSRLMVLFSSITPMFFQRWFIRRFVKL